MLLRLLILTGFFTKCQNDLCLRVSRNITGEEFLDQLNKYYLILTSSALLVPE
jgi:hypothetical protein